MFQSCLQLTAVLIALSLMSAGAQAGDAYAALRPAASVGEPPLILTAAPRESVAHGEQELSPSLCVRGPLPESP